MHVLKLLAPVAAVAGLSACAAATDTSPDLAAARTAEQCFYNSDVRSFSDAAPNVALVSIGAREAWELTLSPGCPSVGTATSIAIVARGGNSRICSGRDAELIVPTASGSSAQRCLVRNVRKLTPEEAAQVRGTPSS